MRATVFFALLLCLLLLTGAHTVNAATEMEIIATGVGRSPASAQVQAQENALRTALGAVVSFEVLTKEEAFVRNLLKQTATFVVEATPLGEAALVDESLFCITLRVRINTAALQATLQQKGLVVARLDGLSLVTAHETRQESREDAGQILVEALHPLPAGALRATAQVQSAHHKFDGKNMRIDLPVIVDIDPQAYALMLDSLRATLQKMGVTSRTVNLSGAGGQAISALWKEAGLPDPLKNKDGPSLLAVCELLAENTSRWSLFQVSAPVAAAFGRDTTVTVKVELLDATGVAVTSRDFSLGGTADTKALANIFAYTSHYRTAGVAPAVNAVDFAADTLAVRQGKGLPQEHLLSFTLGMEELRQISKVRCTVVNKG